VIPFSLSLSLTHLLSPVNALEAAVNKISELGPFGEIHTDNKDLLAGLSFLLSLSNILLEVDGVHPGLMVLATFGIARCLDLFTAFYMCQLHPHTGTAPTFDSNLTPFIVPYHTRLLNMYMSMYLMGGKGPYVLPALTPQSLLQVSCEFHNPWFVSLFPCSFYNTHS
jgi:hypothetical protein